jgi:DNA-binding response OmpR family regulator
MVLLRKPTALGTIPDRKISPMADGPMESGGLKRETKHARILVVDDDPMLANGIARNLRNMGHEPVKTDGRWAFDEFRKGGFDLVISDLDMPFVNGTELIKKIKAVCPNAKIIIHTANETVSDSELLDAGAIDVLRKPVDVQELRDCVSKNLILGDQ